jgi:hypothetical protein
VRRHRRRRPMGGRPSEGVVACVARGGCTEDEVQQRCVWLPTEASLSRGDCGGAAGASRVGGCSGVGRSGRKSYGGGVFGRRSPRWGRHFGATPSSHLGLWVKTLSIADERLRRPRRRTLPGVETSFGCGDSSTLPWLLRLFRQFGRATVRQGVVSLKVEGAAFLLVARGRLSVVISSTCSGPRRLALVQSPVRCGTTSIDGTCGNNSRGRLGLQQIMAGCSSMAGATWCGTTSFDGTGDILSLLARRQLFLVRKATSGIRSSMEVSVLF